MRRIALAGDMKELGQFAWSVTETGERHIWILHPGSAAHGRCRVRLPIKADKRNPDGWDWDGNEDRPTLSPSVHTLGEWHGWVRDGRLIEA